MPCRIQVVPFGEYMDCQETFGPGPRGDACTICVEEISVSSPTVSHMAADCLNVFHSRCLSHWVSESRRQCRDGTCPLCRGVVVVAPPPPSPRAPRVQTNGHRVADIPVQTPMHAIVLYNRNDVIFTYLMHAHHMGWAYYDIHGYVDFPVEHTGAEDFLGTLVDLAIRETGDDLRDGRWMIVHGNAGIVGHALFLTFLWVPEVEVAAIEVVAGYMRESMPLHWR